MSLAKFEHLIAEFPEEQESIKRFKNAFDEGLFSENKEYSVKRIFDLIHPRSQLVLAKMLTSLVDDGVFQKFIRVESVASGEGIQEFNNIEDVPEVIHDWRKDVEMKVTPNDLHIIYRIISELKK